MKGNNILVVAVPRGSELKPLAIRNLPRWVTAGCHGFSITHRRKACTYLVGLLAPCLLQVCKRQRWLRLHHQKTDGRIGP